MQIFSFFYHKMLHWARHPHAPYYLFILSFAESSFFPIPPDVMLAPMVLAKPEHAWRNATLTTLASVLGGIFGYLIGALAFTLIQPLILKWGYQTTFEQLRVAFAHWNFWLMLIAGFAPIPYKLFTIAAGTLHIALLPFILGSIVGRGGRFFLVTGLIVWGGVRFEKLLMRYVERIGYALVILLLLAYIFWYHLPAHS